MQDHQVLKIKQEIGELKARYFYSMDNKDWASLEAVFAPDLIADFRESTGGSDESQLTYGSKEYVEKLAAILDLVTTVHHGHMPQLFVESEREARGIWAMEDKLWPQPGSELPFKWMHGYGYYHEQYVRLHDGWRIKEIRLTRLRVDIG